MATTFAWGNTEASGPLRRLPIELAPPGPDEVLLEVLYCGLCHSDLLHIDEVRPSDAPPAVAGHEVIGRVVEVGDGVDSALIGSVRGLGFVAGTCRHCRYCLSGRQTLCDNLEMTVVGRPGGFASHVKAHQDWVIPIPKALDPASAGPLFCAGITVFEPLFSAGISPTASVAVIGVGGLGHLAVQLARAWGCEVTGITTNAAKSDEIRGLGAHHVVLLPELAQQAGSYDLILNTSDHALDWDAVVGALAPQGCLHQLGLCPSPIPLKVLPFVKGNLSFRSSLTSTPAATSLFLEFCARHEIEALVEVLPMAEINTAIDRLRHGDVRYRFVLQGPA
ncbi:MULTISPECIES: NAD(P)-dependent alcohol dehydrogenase [Aphanothece]|uniref:NAD(P)-dependent alcohol dehydrogenase n=1 Tax=Aphanothece TaxID=1121 RepID=UPI0039856692